MKLEWEQIDPHHKRAKVIGGWLVKAYEDVWQDHHGNGLENGYTWNIAMTFVPDEGHYWKIDK